MKLFQGYPDSVQDVGRGDQGLKLTPTGLMCPEFRVSRFPLDFPSQLSSRAVCTEFRHGFKALLGFSNPAQQQSCVQGIQAVLRLFLDFPNQLSSRAVCIESRHGFKASLGFSKPAQRQGCVQRVEPQF